MRMCACSALLNRQDLANFSLLCTLPHWGDSELACSGFLASTMEEQIHHEDSAFRACKEGKWTCALTDGGWLDETWVSFLEERQWMHESQFKREGDDCPRGTRGTNIFDFECPTVSVKPICNRRHECIMRELYCSMLLH